MTSELVFTLKNKINETLGEKSSDYWAIVKKWLMSLCSTEEFDAECRALFQNPEDSVLHTNFKISLFSKLQISADSFEEVKGSKRKSTKRSTKKRPFFEPANVYDYVPVKQSSQKQILYADGSVHMQTYAAQELFLPDKMMVLGRMLIASWDNDMEDVADNAAEMIVQAVQIFLKNVISSVITSSKSYKSYDKCFRYDIGVDTPNPWVRNSVNILCPKVNNLDSSIKMDVDKAEQRAAFISACSGISKTPVRKHRISVAQLYDALKLNRNVIANHSVYALTMEQIALELDDEEKIDNTDSRNRVNY